MMLRILGFGLVLLLLNAGFVWAFPAPTVFYVGNVLLHLVLGAALLGAMWFGRQPLLKDLRCGSKPTYFMLSLAGALGLVLSVAGATSDNWALVVAHGATGFVGAAMLWSWARRNTRAFAAPLGFALVLALLLPAGGWLRDRYAPAKADIVQNPQWAPASMQQEGGGPESPFFPSSSKTTSGGLIPSDFFLESETCQECHQEIYDQWKASAHRFSSFNNQFYRKSIENMQEIVGTEPSKWCAGCHDHAMFFNGRFETPVVEQLDTPQAHAGLGCMSCHAIVQVADSMGNGGFTMEYPALHDLATSENPVIRTVNKYVTNIAPAAHKRAFMKPFMKTAEYCASCHKVHLDVPVNDYRWFRGFNEYDSWQASGVSGHGARSFYYPAQSQDCADCHMPMEQASLDKAANAGAVRSHRFPAANTALPYVNKDEEQLRVIEEFLQNGIVSVDIFAAAPVEEDPDEPQMIRRTGDAPELATSFAVGEEAAGVGAPMTLREAGTLAAPLDRAGLALRPGDTVRVDVVTRTRKVGHFFPGGTVDSVDCWVELKAVDAMGRDVYWSGKVADDGQGPVEPGAHFFRSVMLDEHGNVINKRNAFQTRSLLYARLIPPGAADVAHFRVEIPEWAVGPLKLEAKVNYRKFSHYYTQYSYAGKADPNAKELMEPGYDERPVDFSPENIPANVSGEIKDRIPALPITVLAQAETEIPLGDDAKPDWKLVAQKDDSLRWNDYGIGLLLQGDLRGAERAFRKVTEADPAYPDGYINIVRTLVAEGRTEEARELAIQGLELGPDLARGHYFYALIHKAAGDYDEALRWLRRAAEQYPKDRVVLNEIARVQFLKRDYAASIETLDRVAAIDPEDLQLQYTRMLAYRGLGEIELAERAETLFRRFKADEASQTRTARIRRTSPEDNNERQPIHEHASAIEPNPNAFSSDEVADND